VATEAILHYSEQGPKLLPHKPYVLSTRNITAPGISGEISSNVLPLTFAAVERVQA